MPQYLLKGEKKVTILNCDFFVGGGADHLPSPLRNFSTFGDIFFGWPPLGTVTQGLLTNIFTFLLNTFFFNLVSPSKFKFVSAVYTNPAFFTQTSLTGPTVFNPSMETFMFIKIPFPEGAVTAFFTIYFF